MRHGEVDNPTGVLYERLPGFHLSPLGREMGAAAARYFREQGRQIELIVTSPLERAQETAAPTAAAYGLEIATDPNFIEAGNVFAGKVVRAEMRSPANWRHYANPLRPSWGEPYADILTRMRRGIRGVLRRLEAAGKTEALVVSHQLPIELVRRWISRRPLAHLPFQRQCSLASVTTLTFVGRGLQRLDYAEPATHLLAQAADLVPGTSAANLNRGKGNS